MDLQCFAEEAHQADAVVFNTVNGEVGGSGLLRAYFDTPGIDVTFTGSNDGPMALVHDKVSVPATFSFLTLHMRLPQHADLGISGLLWTYFNTPGIVLAFNGSNNGPMALAHDKVRSSTAAFKCLMLQMHHLPETFWQQWLTLQQQA